MVEFNKKGIPAELQAEKKFVVFGKVNGRKIPFSPLEIKNKKCASIANPDTWGSFEQACKYYEAHKIVGEDVLGVGYAIEKDSGLVLVDIDCHTDDLDADAKAEAEKKYKAMCSVMEQIETYGENSVSGNGRHYLAKVDLDGSLKIGSSGSMPIEIYTEKRFVLLTGDRLNDYEISNEEKVCAGIRNIHKNYFSKKTSAEVAKENAGKFPILDAPMSEDDVVLKLAMKKPTFELLWNNKWEEVLNKDGKPKYGAKHYANMGLWRDLSFYTRNCPSQMERLYRQSPFYKAYTKEHPKAEREITCDLNRVITSCSAIYNPIGAMRKGYDLEKIYESLCSDSPEERVFSNEELISALKKYCLKYIENIRSNPEVNIVNIEGLENYDLTDLDCKRIVKNYYGDELLYNGTNDKFYYWKGNVFEGVSEESLCDNICKILENVEHRVFAKIVTSTKDLLIEKQDKLKEETEGKAEYKKILKEIESIESSSLASFYRSKKFGCVKNAKTVLTLLKGVNEQKEMNSFFSCPYLNVQNGVLNMHTMELHPHSPIYKQYQITNCSYDANADCPNLRAMLEHMLPSESTRRELQKALGLCLYKETHSAKKIVNLLVGVSDSGKSTLMNSIREMLGTYATAVSMDALMKEKNISVGPELFDFRDALLITASETRKDTKLDEARLKGMSGQTTQSGRYNHANEMKKFVVKGLIFMDTNYKVPLDPEDDAMWRRLRVFNFEQPFVNKNENINKELEKERSGILNFLLEGLQMVQKDGAIIETEEMKAYKAKYRKDLDTVGQFISECVAQTVNQKDRIASPNLYTAYESWCKDAKFHEVVRNDFHEEMKKRFGATQKSGNNYYYTRLAFTPLGNLYLKMKETKPDEFAKELRKLRDAGQASFSLNYADLRGSNFAKARKWFEENILSFIPIILSTITGADRETYFTSCYADYCDWCAENSCPCIRKNDFICKTKWLAEWLAAKEVKSELDADTVRILLLQMQDLWADKEQKPYWTAVA